MSNELIVVTPPVIKISKAPILWDADELERQVEQAIAPYRGTVVTEDTVTGARDVCALLNKSANALDTARKTVKRDWLIPLAEFETRINGIAAKIIDARSDIAGQVSAFDESRRTALLEKLREALKNELADQIERFKIGERFAAGIPVERLLKLSNATQAGNLTEQAVIELELLVAKAKIAQERHLERMAQVDEMNARLGIDLTEQSLGSILQADADTWVRELKRITDVAVAVQAAAMNARKDQEKPAPAPDVTETPQRASAATVDEDGKVSVRVVVELYARIKPRTPFEVVANKVRERLTDAGFTNLGSINVTPR